MIAVSGVFAPMVSATDINTPTIISNKFNQKPMSYYSPFYKYPSPHIP